MLRLHFLFGDDVFYHGPVESVESVESVIRIHLGLVEEERYVIRLLTDEQDPSVRYVLVEDRVISDAIFDSKCLPCYVTKERPRCTVWIDPPLKPHSNSSYISIFYTEYFQFYVNDGSFYTVKYWKSFDDIDLLYPTPLVRARYDYLLSCRSTIPSYTE